MTASTSASARWANAGSPSSRGSHTAATAARRTSGLGSVAPPLLGDRERPFGVVVGCALEGHGDAFADSPPAVGGEAVQHADAVAIAVFAEESSERDEPAHGGELIAGRQ